MQVTMTTELPTGETSTEQVEFTWLDVKKVATIERGSGTKLYLHLPPGVAIEVVGPRDRRHGSRRKR